MGCPLDTEGADCSTINAMAQSQVCHLRGLLQFDSAPRNAQPRCGSNLPAQNPGYGCKCDGSSLDILRVTGLSSNMLMIWGHNQLFRGVLKPFFFIENPKKSMWGTIIEKEEEGIKGAATLANNYNGGIVEIGPLFERTTNLIDSTKNFDAPLITDYSLRWNPFHLTPYIHRQFKRRSLRYCLDHCTTKIFDGDVMEF